MAIGRGLRKGSRLSLQKDTLFKMLNAEIVYPVQDARP